LAHQKTYAYLSNKLNDMSNILIIDDERSIRNVLKDILSNEGYKMDEAADGEEGFKKFTSNNYDLVLCDIKMPKMDGLDFLQKAYILVY
jgi:CheY-like chemotaxis protein